MCEFRVVNTIVEALKRRLETSKTLKETARNPSFRGQDYAAEAKVLSAIAQVGVVERMVATVVSFAFLRRGPAIIGRLLERRSFRSGYRLDNPTQQSQRHGDSSPSRRGIILLAGMIRLGVDVTLSVLVGATTSMRFSATRQTMMKVSDLPLVEGRSIVCDEFCTTIMQEVAKQHKEDRYFWKTVTTNHDNLPLEGIHRFSINCQKRQAFEQKLREEQGLRSGEPVSIPSGGVPRDFEPEDGDAFTFQPDDADGNGESELGELTFGDGESLFGNEKTDQWGESLVTDRENDRK